MLCPSCSKEVPEVAGPCPKCGVLIPAFALPANSVANKGLPSNEPSVLTKALFVAIGLASAFMGLKAYQDHGAGMGEAISRYLSSGKLIAPPQVVNTNAARAEEHAMKLARELEKSGEFDAAQVQQMGKPAEVKSAQEAAQTPLAVKAAQSKDAANARASEQDAQIENLEKR